MTAAAWIVYTLSMGLLYWIYDGYGRFLRLIAPAATKTPIPDCDELPSMTVLLTVHNEQNAVADRLRNLLACEYPTDRLEILVASDGSTDATNDIVRSFSDQSVRLFESPGLGKTATQNAAIETIGSDIIVFTDADIVFDSQFLKAVAGRFRDPEVGAVDGRLLYGRNQTETHAAAQGFYWRYELKLREAETRLGWLAVVAGASFAVRRSVLRPMDPSIGEDCIVPLDVVLEGYRVAHEVTAKAYNEFEEGTQITMRRRIRMTLRNWQGTWSRPDLLNPFRHPGYAFSLWSHKMLRWLSPVFLLTGAASAGLLLGSSPSWFTAAAALPFVGLAVLSLAGRIASGRIPGSGMAFSFVVANTAFLIGICRAVAGRRVHRYRNV